jgi:hypothetical protein
MAALSFTSQFQSSSPQTELTRSAVDLYVMRANEIRKSAGGSDFVSDVLPLLRPSHPSEELHFVLLDASSGVGKTQSVFVLLGADGFLKDFKGVYVPLGGYNEGGQPIYRAFHNEANLLTTAVKVDANVALTRLGFSLDVNPSLDNVGTSFAQDWSMIALVIGKLLGLEFKDEKVTLEMLRELVSKMGKRPVVFLDEVQVGDIWHLALLRNCLRWCNIMAVLLGTDASAANIIPSAQASRGGSDSIWVHVVVKFPTFCLDALSKELRDAFGRIPPNIQSVVTTARPWFACLILETLQSQPTSEVNLRLFAQVCSQVWQKKQKLRSDHGALGQLCLMMAAHSDLKEKNSGYVLVSHFARLVNPDRNDGRFFSLKLCQEGLTLDPMKANYSPQAVFPTPSEELALYLICLPGHIVHKQRDGSPVSLSVASAMKRFEKKQIPCAENPQAPVADGSRAEAIAAAALAAASHHSLGEETALMEYLGWLAAEVSAGHLGREPWRVVDERNLLRVVGDIRIPFLLPPTADNTLRDEKHLNFDLRKELGVGTVERTVAGTKCDVFLYSAEGTPIIQGECKLRKTKNLPVDVLLPMLAKTSQRQTKLDLIFCTTLQNHYEQSGSAWDKAFPPDSRPERLSTFRLVELKLDSTNNVAKVVSFGRGFPEVADGPNLRVVMVIVCPDWD